PVGRRARIEHLFPSPSVIVASRGGALLRVHGAPSRLAAHPLGGTLDSFGENVTESFAVGQHLEHPIRVLDVSPLGLETHLLFSEIPLVHALHHPATEPTELVDVDARAVEPRVEPADRLLVGDAERPTRSRPALVFGLVDELALAPPTRNDLDVTVVH